jgi:hypothetical protein
MSPSRGNNYSQGQKIYKGQDRKKTEKNPKKGTLNLSF